MVDIKMEFKSLNELYRSYMPFIKPAAIFIPTHHSHHLGDFLEISYQLPNGSENQLSGTVVWINPIGASGGRPVGVGIKLETDSDEQRLQIEKLLASNLGSGDLTSTM
ncbi:pilus assembly protein PilZ [Parashewanella spongiae]|uniref:Pilus assembly protein PilZ n=1 Tax=Parashewanella spongiae TaxID=342950 RepID=A0A3A6U2S2_9GAMM|nr:PilZ domain-containing protein [Parashewanella spongiae]MCL1077346.1 PilZ domain-containing protein [Parashewanella spongiae]RJY18313.1 pilus assembly protein PilZ [Parashewanella spongiae]